MVGDEFMDHRGGEAFIPLSCGRDCHAERKQLEHSETTRRDAHESAVGCSSPPGHHNPDPDEQGNQRCCRCSDGHPTSVYPADHIIPTPSRAEPDHRNNRYERHSPPQRQLDKKATRGGGAGGGAAADGPEPAYALLITKSPVLAKSIQKYLTQLQNGSPARNLPPLGRRKKGMIGYHKVIPT